MWLKKNVFITRPAEPSCTILPVQSWDSKCPVPVHSRSSPGTQQVQARGIAGPVPGHNRSAPGIQKAQSWHITGSVLGCKRSSPGTHAPMNFKQTTHSHSRKSWAIELRKWRKVGHNKIPFYILMMMIEPHDVQHKALSFSHKCHVDMGDNFMVSEVEWPEFSH